MSCSLIRSRQTLAKCLAADDALGATNALNVELSAELALAKCADTRGHIRHLQSKLHETATDAGFELGPQRVYRMAKSSVAGTNAKKLDQMYASLTASLKVSGPMRQEIEALRSEVVAMAQGMGCRLKNGSFVPYAS